MQKRKWSIKLWLLKKVTQFCRPSNGMLTCIRLTDSIFTPFSVLTFFRIYEMTDINRRRENTFFNKKKVRTEVVDLVCVFLYDNESLLLILLIKLGGMVYKNLLQFNFRMGNYSHVTKL